MVLSILGRAAARAGSFLGRNSLRAGAAGAAGGAAGGVLLDDIPFLSQLDPTEGGGGNQITKLVIVGLVFVIALGSLFDIQVGG